MITRTKRELSGDSVKAPAEDDDESLYTRRKPPPRNVSDADEFDDDNGDGNGNDVLHDDQVQYKGLLVEAEEEITTPSSAHRRIILAQIT